MTGWYQWRGHPWPTKLEGHGDKPSISAYPNQGLDIQTTPYFWLWLSAARQDAKVMSRTNRASIAAGDFKYGLLEFTPLGTFVPELTRTGGDYLDTRCGYCGLRTQRCRCALESAE